MICDDPKHYGYLHYGDDNQIYHIKKGQVIAGYTLGILLIDVWYPLLPGNVVNSSTFDFPVRHKLIPNATQKRVHKGDITLLDDIVQAGKELEMEGVRAICGACGYLGNFQPQIADALDTPVFLSSLLQIPMIKVGLKKHQKIGILCADKPDITEKVLRNCNIDSSICVIEGIGEKTGFSAILNSNTGSFNNELVKQEVVEGALKLTQKYSEIGAILLECSDMPPYAVEVQRHVKLPVFDFITLIKWVHHSVAQKPYFGFI